uniref:PH domain-containing protein n=1 Tax=Schistocephalus solidus TaxID=70667 RepID=A0A183T3D7_SCHSO
LRLRAADAKERQLWVNRVRAVAEYQTEQATESVQSTSSPPAQLPSLLPVKERSSSALNGSASDQIPRTLVRPPSTPSYSKSGKSSESSSRRPEKRSESSSPFPAIEPNSACTSPVFLDPLVQLHELFRMLEQEGMNLSNDIDNLYTSPALTFAHRNPEVTEVYRFTVCVIGRADTVNDDISSLVVEIDGKVLACSSEDFVQSIVVLYFKVVLPTFILERRSLLEMFADYMAHPHLFIGQVS